CDNLAQYGKNVLLIGHIPDLEYLTSYLLSSQTHIKISFRKTSICFIEIEDFPPYGTGTLHWMFDSDLLTS
ncbi:MAG: hypothetical protein Q8Q33_01335, partial [Chlamydiota bacterium]|nr:hypothetical protein [Chlamydiota bacterium]